MDASERWRILRLHVEDGIPLTALARETGIGLRTLERWHYHYRSHGTLAPTEKPTATRRVAASLISFTEHLALTRPRPPIATIHRLVTAEAERTDLPAPSYPTVRRIVIALDPALVTLALEGPASYRDRHELVLRRRADRPNAIWQADHTQLDILTVGAKPEKPDRPWLTVILDDYSRAICGYTVFLGAPSAMNTALALRQAIWRKPDPVWVTCGIPDILHVDHGSDFTSRHLEHTATALRIRIIHSTVGRPQGRGKIERFFRTINTELLTSLPGHLTRAAARSKPTLTLQELDSAVGSFVTTHNQRAH